jgi:hypothetical protein
MSNTLPLISTQTESQAQIDYSSIEYHNQRKEEERLKEIAHDEYVIRLSVLNIPYRRYFK